MSNEQDEKIFNYIAALEKANEELVKTLKLCVEVLTQFKSSVSDPKGWQKMLDEFQKAIKAGETIVQKKTLH